MENPAITIPELPNDVIIEILLRLPAKLLSRFRCVCKSWRALTSSHEFIRNHLKISKSDPIFSAHKIILYCNYNLKQFSVNSMLYGPIPEALELVCPVRNTTFIGCCDGLICLDSEDRKDLFLWNPCTGLCKKLTDSGLNIFYGRLGFAELSDDYKVVAGVYNEKIDLLRVEVYSLRRDEWKMIKDYENSPSLMKDYNGRSLNEFAKSVNGKFYWLFENGSELEKLRCDIVSLDLEKEEFETLQLPSYVEIVSHCKMVVTEGSLYLLCECRGMSDMWMMMDDEVNWTKVFTFPHNYDFLRTTIVTDMYLVKKNDQFLLLLLSHATTLLMFDAKDCSFRYREEIKCCDFAVLGDYFESLVSPFGCPEPAGAREIGDLLPKS